MPIIATINYLIVRMYFKDHAPPHFHVEGDETNGLFAIQTLQMFEGNLSSKEQKIIKEWATDKQEILFEMWETQKITKI